MAIVEISTLPKPVAIGLDWHPLPGATSERREIDALAKRHSAQFGCVYTDESTSVTTVGLSTEKTEAPAGAAWLARASGRQGLILVEPLPDGRIWICSVRAGSPVQGQDLVVDESSLHERLKEILREGVDARICSTIDGLEQSYSNISQQSFAELVSAVNPVRIKRISGTNPTFVLSVGVLIVGTAAYFGWEHWTKQQLMQEADRRIAAQSARQQQSAQAQAEMIRKEREAAIQQILAGHVLNRPAVKDSIGAYMKALETVPMSTGGWSLAAFDCSGLECMLTWERKKPATIATFLAAAERNGWAVLSAQGDAAMTVVRVQIEPRTAAATDLVEASMFAPAFETKLQEANALGMTYTIDKMVTVDETIAKSAPIATAAAAGPQGQGAGALPPAPPSPSPFKLGTASLKGDRLFEIRESPAFLEHSAIAIKHLKGDMKAGNWTMDINYATR